MQDELKKLKTKSEELCKELEKTFTIPTDTASLSTNIYYINISNSINLFINGIPAIATTEATKLSDIFNQLRVNYRTTLDNLSKQLKNLIESEPTNINSGKTFYIKILTYFCKTHLNTLQENQKRRIAEELIKNINSVLTDHIINTPPIPCNLAELEVSKTIRIFAEKIIDISSTIHATEQQIAKITKQLTVIETQLPRVNPNTLMSNQPISQPNSPRKNITPTTTSPESSVHSRKTSTSTLSQNSDISSSSNATPPPLPPRPPKRTSSASNTSPNNNIICNSTTI